MSMPTPKCETVKVFAFLGDRTRAFITLFLQKLNDEKNGSGAGPTMLECQFYGGHTGVSIDGGSTIFGFNPDPKGLPMWKLMDDLKQGRAFDGIVADDTAVFAAAQSKGLQAISFEIRLPPATFRGFTGQLDSAGIAAYPSRRFGECV